MKVNSLGGWRGTVSLQMAFKQNVNMSKSWNNRKPVGPYAGLEQRLWDSALGGNHQETVSKDHGSGKGLERKGRLSLIAASTVTLSTLFQNHSCQISPYSVSMKHTPSSLTKVSVPKPNPVLNCPQDLWNKEVFALRKQHTLRILQSEQN